MTGVLVAGTAAYIGGVVVFARIVHAKDAARRERLMRTRRMIETERMRQTYREGRTR